MPDSMSELSCNTQKDKVKLKFHTAGNADIFCHEEDILLMFIHAHTCTKVPFKYIASVYVSCIYIYVLLQECGPVELSPLLGSYLVLNR